MNERIISEVQNTSESVESKDEDVVLDYKEYVSSKSVVDSLTKLLDYFKG